MVCAQCGASLDVEADRCPRCGAPTKAEPYPDSTDAFGVRVRGQGRPADEPISGPVQYDAPAHRLSQRALLLIGGAVLAALVIGLVLTFVVFRPATGPTAAPQTRTVTVSATGSSSTTPPSATSRPSTTASTSAYPNLMLTGAFCGTDGNGRFANYAVGNPGTTSCPFAHEVRAAFLASGAPPGGAFTATSPVTGKAYQMSCTGDQPVTCTGGNGAIVYFYGGTATFST